MIKHTAVASNGCNENTTINNEETLSYDGGGTKRTVDHSEGGHNLSNLLMTPYNNAKKSNTTTKDQKRRGRRGQNIMCP